MNIGLAVLRTLVGLAFVVAGIIKLVTFEHSAAAFTRWGIPAGGAVAIIVSATEIVCGLLFAVGALTRPVGLLLATLMVAATLTAGRVEGGIYLVLPPLGFFLTVFFAWRAGRFPGLTSLRRPGVN